MVTFVKPVVPEGPLTVNSSTSDVELNATSETVEFETIEKGESPSALSVVVRV